jgi:hypothetical protein
VIVPVITVLGFPISRSQYSEITTPDMTPRSYPNKLEHTNYYTTISLLNMIRELIGVL